MDVRGRAYGGNLSTALLWLATGDVMEEEAHGPIHITIWYRQQGGVGAWERGALLLDGGSMSLYATFEALTTGRQAVAVFDIYDVTLVPPGGGDNLTPPPPGRTPVYLVKKAGEGIGECWSFWNPDADVARTWWEHFREEQLSHQHSGGLLAALGYGANEDLPKLGRIKTGAGNGEPIERVSDLLRLLLEYAASKGQLFTSGSFLIQDPPAMTGGSTDSVFFDYLRCHPGAYSRVSSHLGPI